MKPQLYHNAARRQEDRLEPFFASVSIVLAIAGLLVLLFAAWVNAQTPADLQRQIEKLERTVESTQARQFDWSGRLAAVEREVEINRYLVSGLALPVIGQVVVSVLLYRRLNGYRTNSRGPTNS